MAYEYYTPEMSAEWIIEVREQGNLKETITKTNRLMGSYISSTHYGRFPEIVAQCLVGATSYVSTHQEDSNGVTSATYAITCFGYGNARTSYDAGALTDLKGTNVIKKLAYKGVGETYNVAKFTGWIGTTENTISPICEMGLFNHSDDTDAHRLLFNRVVFPGIVKDANNTINFECRIRVNFIDTV